MAFYLVLLCINVCCFLPLYGLNFSERPNPVEFLFDRESLATKIKRLYGKPGFTDPFRINFDFTFLTLAAAAAGYSGAWLTWCLAAVLTFGIVEITYSSIMRYVFKRSPAIVSDLSLIKAGLSIVERDAVWILAAASGLLALIAWLAYQGTALAVRLMPEGFVLPAIGAGLLIPLCLYHWRMYAYEEFMSRTVYSPALHFYRNLELSKVVRAVFAKGPEHFEKLNHFKGVKLVGAPNVIVICIESYGSIVYRDAESYASVQDFMAECELRLAGLGYGFASNYSEAPIFAGGTWASYTSFTYGFLLDDLQLFDGLFVRSEAFRRYESLFHVLRRNSYENVLLCPLGGPDISNLDWQTIGRCFQSDRNIAFEDLEYTGQRLTYLGLDRRYSAPDQYSLNYAYESAKRSAKGPFSLFYCTLNSHFPWDSPVKAVDDWRDLNDSAAVRPGSSQATVTSRYRDAIRYQLDYILRFVADNADDDLLVVLFGDHQPPFLTPERFGKQTPVHVISRNRRLLEVLEEHGFVAAMNLAGIEPEAIRHEGFLSLFLKGMQAAYGANDELEIEYREHGIALFDEQALRIGG